MQVVGVPTRRHSVSDVQGVRDCGTHRTRARIDHPSADPALADPPILTGACVLHPRIHPGVSTAILARSLSAGVQRSYADAYPNDGLTVFERAKGGKRDTRMPGVKPCTSVSAVL